MRPPNGEGEEVDEGGREDEGDEEDNEDRDDDDDEGGRELDIGGWKDREKKRNEVLTNEEQQPANQPASE